jgi:hypothetical protein
VRAAVLADPELTERQKQVLLEIYESFRRELAARAAEDTETATGAEPIAGAEPFGIEAGGMLPGEPGPNGAASQADGMPPDVAGLGRDANAVPE